MNEKNPQPKERDSYWSIQAYRNEEEHDNDDYRRGSLLINILIALAIILSFIGLIVFPQVLLPGLLLSGCLIAAQALAGFAILTAISKIFFTVYHQGVWGTLRRMLLAPIDFFRDSFDKHPLITASLVFSFLAIAVVLILSGTGVITIPVLTVFAANSLSLEITEIIAGLLSDIVVISAAALLCYLPTFLKKIWNEWNAAPIGTLSIESTSMPEGVPLHLLDVLPSEFQNLNYENSYILVDEKRLFFIGNDRKHQEIQLYEGMKDNFTRVFSKICTDRPPEGNKIILLGDDEMNLIGANAINPPFKNKFDNVT